MAELTPQQHAWIQAYQQRQAQLLQQKAWLSEKEETDGKQS